MRVTKHFLALLSFVFLAKAYAYGFIVADAEDRLPLGGATLLSDNGTILGISDSHGSIDCSPSAFPVRIHCMGYVEANLSAIVDTVFLTPKTFELSEIVIEQVEKPVLKLDCYIREYTTSTFGTDTVQLFAEYMADYFLTEKKVKGFKSGDMPYKRVQRMRVRHKNAAGLDSIYRPAKDDVFLSWVDICSINPHGYVAPDSIVNGATGVKMGKFGRYSTTRVNGNKLTYSRDILANHKGHHWAPWFMKVIGFTIDMTEMLGKDVFQLDDNSYYGPNTLQMATYTMEMTIKSKWAKKEFHTKEPIKTYSVIEVYPLETKYLTAEAAKEQEWEYSRKEITPSPLAPQLPQNILEMINAEIK